MENPMKMNPKLLSLPPYISTPWKNIFSLHLEEKGAAPLLIVTLQNRMRVEIPDLNRSAIEEIFAAHANAQESDLTPSRGTPPFPFGLQISSKLENDSPGMLTSVMGHNVQYADLPTLPDEFLNKIRTLLKALGIDQSEALPKPEPHCNCFFCQIARLFHGEAALAAEKKEAPEEEISEHDLHFRTWDIRQTSDKLYLVSNPLDNKEHYSVFLGDPIGCTCGQKNCEHIRAVLNT